MSWRYEAQVDGRWYPNSVYFETEREAKSAADVKMWSWTQCQDTRVVEDDSAVNYRFDFETGRSVHIATEGATSAG